MYQEVEYTVVKAATPDDLSTNVNSCVATGWRPLGGMTLAFDSSNTPTYAQAMTKRPDEPEEEPEP